MSGLIPANGATNQSIQPLIRIEFCGMTGLWLNKFNLLNPNGSVFKTNGPDFNVTYGSYWAELAPTMNLSNGLTYSLEIEGRINHNGTVKQIDAGTWAFTIRDVEDPGVLYNEDFGDTAFTIPHTLTATECQNNFGWTNTLPAVGGTMHLVDDPDPSVDRGTVLKIDFAEGNYGTGVPVPGYAAAPNGMRSQIWSDAGRDELYFAFDIYFPADFIFPLTMRGPALWGGVFHETTDPGDYGTRVAAEIRNHGSNLDADDINSQYVCQQSNTVDGEIGLYSYDAVQSQYAQKTGIDYKKGEWNRVEFYVLKNDPVTSTNGKFHCWLNGSQVIANNAVQWASSVDSGLQFETGHLLFSGDSSCWISPKSQSLYIDNLIISENRIHGVDIDEIQIYSANNWYWEYKGSPTLLLGGSIHSNLFHISNLQSELDTIQAAGGNYVRCTMSQRTSWNLSGDMEVPYAGSVGNYDLDTWNASYWTDFANMLQWCDERDIIVQIELFDRWDYRGSSWDENAFNPSNNSNYTSGESGLPTSIGSNPNFAELDFFNSVPDLDDNTFLIAYQHDFVDEVLNHCFQYGNILYTVGNESKAYEDWGIYWSTYMKNAAAAAGVSIETTQMYDAWDMDSDRQRLAFDHPETYSYIDISQNSHKGDQTNWTGFQYARTYIDGDPRPINSTKIYGADGVRYSDDHGVECFWRNIIGGCASSRFHRPPDGLGIDTTAQNSIKAARLLEEKVTLWDMVPDTSHSLLSNRTTDEAYLSYEAGSQYAIYFTNGGAVNLDLVDYGGDIFGLHWISIDDGTLYSSSTIAGGGTRTITAPTNAHWVAAIPLDTFVRPFGPNAPWNIPVAGLDLHDDTAIYAEYLFNHAGDRSDNFNLSFVDFTYPIYYVEDATAMYTVNGGQPNIDGTEIPWNPAWTAGGGSDAQVILLDQATGEEIDLWQVEVDGTTLNISNGSRVPGSYYTKEDGWPSSRGCGIQYLAMLIRPEEIVQGVIEHGMSMPIRNTSHTFYVAPATKLEWPDPPDDPNPIPEGMRFYLDITQGDIDTWVATKPAAYQTIAGIIGACLRDYGWFITDTSGASSIQLESVLTATPAWESMGIDPTSTTARDLLDGIFTEARIKTVVPSDEY